MTMKKMRHKKIWNGSTYLFFFVDEMSRVAFKHTQMFHWKIGLMVAVGSSFIQTPSVSDGVKVKFFTATTLSRRSRRNLWGQVRFQGSSGFFSSNNLFTLFALFFTSTLVTDYESSMTKAWLAAVQKGAGHCFKLFNEMFQKDNRIRLKTH